MLILTYTMTTMERRACSVVTAIITVLIFIHTALGQDQCVDGFLIASSIPNYFSSANYPGQYPSNMDCKWYISTFFRSRVVILNVSDFSLDGSQPLCTGDYVKIYDGLSTSSSQIQVLCGSLVSGRYESTGSDMTVVFHSDGGASSYYRGFRFSYQSIDKSQPSSAPCTDVTLFASSAPNYFSSANYPSTYPSYMDCQWYIKAGSYRSVVVLSVSDFSLHGMQPMCTGDSVKIYDGPSTYSRQIQVLCGSLVSGRYESTSSDMTVVFHSDGIDNFFTGFRFSYQSREQSLPTSDPCTDVTLFASSAPNYFSSANYPSTYPSYMDCKWYIWTGSSVMVVVLSVFDFNLDGLQPSCTGDYVKIYDGPSTFSNQIQILCGSLVSGSYESTGSNMTVVFHSNGGANYYTGFYFSYQSRGISESSSDVTFQASSALNYFSSANYPSQYPRNMDYSWYIKAESTSSVVVLSVATFMLDGIQPSCTGDYVKIYDGPSTFSRVLKVLCGSSINGSFESTSSDMTVVFHSDMGDNYFYSGFRFSYQSRNEFIQDNSQASSGFSSKYIGIIVGVVTGCIVLGVITAIACVCFRRRVARKEQRSSRNRVVNGNVGSHDNLFVVNLRENNTNTGSSPPMEMLDSQSMPGPHHNTLNSQSSLQPPSYSSLNFDLNDSPLNYTPRGTDCNTNYPPPPIYTELPDDGAQYGQSPLLHGQGLEQSLVGPETTSDDDVYVNSHDDVYVNSHDDVYVNSHDDVYVNSHDDVYVNMGFHSGTSDQATPDTSISHTPPIPSAPLRDSFMNN